MKNNLLITGNLGYIGSVLTNYLDSEKYAIKGYDIGYFKDCLLTKVNDPKVQIIKDIRDVSKEDLEGVHSVIHLAALSNDPLGEFNPSLTREINFQATIRLAEIAKFMGVTKFIFFSSQSMYGISESQTAINEDDSRKNPVTEYAKTKWEAECELKRLASDNFKITCLRPSTVFGLSPRLRCDIVYNNLLSSAFTKNSIEILSDGTPWRPVIHVKDVCQVVSLSLQSQSKDNIRAYNIGLENGNFTVKDLAMAAKGLLPGANLTFLNEHNDPRSYKVSFKRIFNEFPDYSPSWDLKSGGMELLKEFRRSNFSTNDLVGRKFIRLNQLKYLIEKGLIDKNLKRIL